MYSNLFSYDLTVPNFREGLVYIVAPPTSCSKHSTLKNNSKNRLYVSLA